MDLKNDPVRIEKIFSILKQAIPDAAIELEYDDPYCLLVSVLLSARSTDIQVNRATKDLFKIAKTPESMLKLGYEGLCQYVNTVGLYKTKAKNIIALSEILIKKHNSKIPDTREELMELPGIGLKSANVILNVLHGHATIAVDTHVFRVATRLELSQAKTPNQMSHELEALLSKHLDHNLMMIAHHLMVLHGRYVCKAIKPRCQECPLYSLCSSKDKIINS